MATIDRIDTHQHYIPPFYRAQIDARDLTAGGWPTPDWGVDGALALMDTEQIATGIVSVSSPGVHFGDDGAARKLARSVNEYGAELVKDRPDRFGLFASLPLPDVDGAIAEAVYAFEELAADGVVLMSNVRGTYLGDSAYEPLWQELDAREAVVFIHPDQPPLRTLPGMPGPVLDYPFDTTRTALHMVVNGVLGRYQRLRIILSHGGGFLPYAAQRLVGVARFNRGLTPESVLDDLKRFWFDTALSSTPFALPSLLAFAQPGRITFGTDHPFAPPAPFDQVLDSYDLEAATRYSINRGSAEKLFPRLARDSSARW